MLFIVFHYTITIQFSSVHKQILKAKFIVKTIYHLTHHSIEAFIYAISSHGFLSKIEYTNISFIIIKFKHTFT